MALSRQQVQAAQASMEARLKALQLDLRARITAGPLRSATLEIVSSTLWDFRVEILKDLGERADITSTELRLDQWGRELDGKTDVTLLEQRLMPLHALAEAAVSNVELRDLRARVSGLGVCN